MDNETKSSVAIRTEKLPTGAFYCRAEMFELGGDCTVISAGVKASSEREAIAQALRQVADRLAKPTPKAWQNFADALAAQADRWLPANGGTEEPFVSRSGRRLLYCYNPALGKHAYMDLDNDIILTDSDAQHLMGM